METRWLYTTSENFPTLREAAGRTCVMPMGCNERIGKAALRIEAERLANAFKVFKEDTVLPKWQAERSWRAEHACFNR